ncbi:MAG: hypothetical protein GF408_03730 [Candidatus Omnitrophica bacterium]|nr:hypothetical protein [Candidatus Omnitrophota bacterium]
MKECIHCGRSIANNARKCRYCGGAAGRKEESAGRAGAVFGRFFVISCSFLLLLLVFRFALVPSVSLIGKGFSHLSSVVGSVILPVTGKRKTVSPEAPPEKPIPARRMPSREKEPFPPDDPMNFAKRSRPEESTEITGTAGAERKQKTPLPEDGAVRARENGTNLMESRPRQKDISGMNASAPGAASPAADKCALNLKAIESAKILWYLETGSEGSRDPEWTDLVPQYLAKKPECPCGGEYIIGTGYHEACCSRCGKAVDPALYSAGEHAMNNIFSSASVRYVRCPRCKAEINRSEMSRSIKNGRAQCPFCGKTLYSPE